MRRLDLEQRPWIGALLVALCGLVYANSLNGVFVYDDFGTIVGNPHLESLWPLSRAMSAPPGSGSSGRPVVAFSFALNYALGGREVFGYHLVNVLVHVLTGLALFGAVRRGLGWLARQADPAIPPTLAATLVAVVWMVHPLNSAALNHLTYRNEALLALFYTSAIYAALRGFAAERGVGGERPSTWFALSVAACALAIGCKEIAVSAPVVVWFLNVTLFRQGWWESLRTHRAFYAGLAGTWLLLAWIVASGDRGESVGAGSEGISSLDYLRTQAGVLLHYLRLALWPAPLVLDYRDWEVAREWSGVWPQGLGVLALFGISLWALLRRNAKGAVAVGAFAILAPTSSFIPITGAIAAEHRMYLPLAGLVLLAGAAALAIARRIGLRDGRLSLALTLLALIVAVPLGAATVLRNRDYHSGLAIWEDTIEKRPNNSLAWSNYGGALYRHGRREETERAVLRAIELNPGNYKALDNLGMLLRERGDLRGAADAYRRASAARPDLGLPLFELGRALVDLGELEEGAQQLDRALDLGLAPADQERVAFQVATLFATAEDDALRNGPRALELALQLDRLSGGTRPRYLDLLAAALAENGRFDEAVETARRALAAAQQAGRAKQVENLRSKLTRYEAGEPWRQAVR